MCHALNERKHQNVKQVHNEFCGLDQASRTTKIGKWNEKHRVLFTLFHAANLRLQSSLLFAQSISWDLMVSTMKQVHRSMANILFMATQLQTTDHKQFRKEGWLDESLHKLKVGASIILMPNTGNTCRYTHLHVLGETPWERTWNWTKQPQVSSMSPQCGNVATFHTLHMFCHLQPSLKSRSGSFCVLCRTVVLLSSVIGGG